MNSECVAKLVPITQTIQYTSVINMAFVWPLEILIPRLDGAGWLYYNNESYKHARRHSLPACANLLFLNEQFQN